MQVQCHVYDLSNGLARAMSMAVVGKQVDIIPHTGIVVFGREFFFGGGVCTTPVGQAMPMPPCEIIQLGTTAKTEAEVTAFLSQISPRYTAATYNLLSHNCNHFSNELVHFLTGGAACVPARIVNIADEALSAPAGQQLRVMIEGMQSNMFQNSTANQFNPLGHVPAAPVATVPVPAVAAVTTPSPPPVSSGALDLDSLRAALMTVETNRDVEVRRACLSTVARLGRSGLGFGLGLG